MGIFVSFLNVNSKQEEEEIGGDGEEEEEWYFSRYMPLIKKITWKWNAIGKFIQLIN